MHIASKFLSIALLLALALGAFSAAPAAPSIPWQSKVDPWVLNTAAEGETEFLILLSAQADLSGAAALKTKLEKGNYVYQKLTEVANRTQGAVIADLQARGVAYQPYYIANMIWVRGGSELVQAMAERPDVAHLYANPKVMVDMPTVNLTVSPESPEAIEWNIQKVEADEVWQAGFTGQGAVIGGQDTGYDWDHPALKNQYRGWNGSQADHNYNWHDAIHQNNPNTPPGNPCGFNSQVPCDDQQHGTHTMGTMVGDDGGSNQIGMAPGARWIGCRNMEQGWGTPTTYAECYEWFIAPYPLGGTPAQGDPSKAPDVINNSWGCPPSEGCTDPNVLLTVVNNVRAAGILTAHSAGNSGSACSTVNDPAAIYAASFTVGATDSSDNIAGFSSRGPVDVDGSFHMKPNISAPGVGIRSSVPGGGYLDGWQGTSMAAPHVAGLVALLISANPNLAGQVDTLEDIIEQTAVHRNSAACDPPGTTYPNNVYGWGRIDSYGAYLGVPAFDLTKIASNAVVFPGELLTYTLTLTNRSSLYSTSSIVLTDTLPVGTSFVNATLPYSINGSTVRWVFTSLDPNETVNVDLVVAIDTAARGTLVNDDYAARSTEIPTTFGAPVTTDVISADMLLSKSAPPAVVPGGVLTYTLTVTNPYSTIPIHNVVLTDVLPTDTTFITATLPHTMLAGALRWDFPSLAASQNQPVELVVQAPLSGTVSNLGYSVSASEADPASGQPVNTAVVPYSLALDKTAPAAVASGGVLTYALTVNNPHPVATTHNLVLTDTLPVNTAFITATQSVSITGDLITWSLPLLAPQETWTVQLFVHVPLTFTGTVVNKSYGVRNDEVPMVAGLPVSTQILGLNLNKQASVSAVTIGDLINYTLTVTNQHPLSTTHSLVLSDTLPANTAFVSSDGQLDQGTQTITWKTGSLDPGEASTVHLTVQVLPDAAGPIVNFDYRVTSDETPEPIFGPKVETPLMSFIFMPVVLNSHSD